MENISILFRGNGSLPDLQNRLLASVIILATVYGCWKFYRVGFWLGIAMMTLLCIFAVIYIIRGLEGALLLTMMFMAVFAIFGTLIAVCNIMDKSLSDDDIDKYNPYVLQFDNLGCMIFIIIIVSRIVYIIMDYVNIVITISFFIAFFYFTSKEFLNSKKLLNGLFIILFISCFFIAYFSLVSEDHAFRNLLLVNLCLCAFIHACFYWLNLGMVRALLYSTLDQKGKWPLISVLVMFICAILTSIFMAIFMVLAVQLFGHLEILGGVKEMTVNVQDMLKALADPPALLDTQYVVFYVLLFTPFIPLIVNILAMAGCKMRSLHGLTSWCARLLPENGAISASDALTVTLWLALVTSIGVIAGLLLCVLLFYTVAPAYANMVIGWLQILIDADYPAQILAIF